MLQLLTSDQALTNIREKGLMECILNINPMLSTSWVKRSLASTKGALKTCNKEWSRKFSMEADHRNQQYQCLRFSFLQCLLARLKWSRRLSWFRQALSPERQFLKPVIGCNSEAYLDLELWGQGVAYPARFSSIWEFFYPKLGQAPPLVIIHNRIPVGALTGARSCWENCFGLLWSSDYKCLPKDHVTLTLAGIQTHLPRNSH